MATYNTPLRYPGGKQKIAPFVREIILENGLQGISYIEPYAGGAGVAIELLLSGIVGKILLNDSCLSVYSFWNTVLKDPEWLCKKISLASLTIEEWKKQREILRNRVDYSISEIGFATLYLNRCNRSGILSGGVIGGLEQNGYWKMDARFSRKELIRRIEAIANNGDRISVSNKDAEIFIDEYNTSSKSSAFLYCDPPYLKKADRLYLNHYLPDDHKRIAEKIQSIEKEYWIVSYDSSEYIANLYGQRKKFIYNLQYNARRAYLGSELFIFSDALSIPKCSEIKAIDSVLQRNTINV